MTGETRMDSAAVAWLHQMDIEKISEARAKLPEDWSYLPLTRDTVTSGKNSYLTNSYSWKRLAEYLMLYLELSEEEAVDLQEDYWRDLVSGETVDSFRQMLVDLTDPEGLQDWLMVWDVSFSAGLECPQAGLKGYSRQEYQRKTGEWPAFLPLSTGSAKKMVFIHTHLFELPLSDQLALHDMFMMPRGRGEDPRYREMDERYTRNAEVQYLLALIDREEERYEAAEERFKAIRKIAAGYSEEMFDILCLMKMEMLEQEMSRLFGEKPKKNGEKARAYLEAHPILEEEEERIMELLPGEEREAFRKISSIYKEMQSEKKNVTLRRAAPKVGRNDPCPCGSGKKYKHCCGR